MEIRSFQLELPRETTNAKALSAGEDYLVNTLRLGAYADYSWNGSKPHPTMSGMRIFSYRYKA
jgi:hypothetical protein